MAAKYELQWKDIDGLDCYLSIGFLLYEGGKTQLKGQVSISQDASDDLYQAIRSTLLTINIVTDTTQDLSELWEQDERYWDVFYSRDSVEIFRGYLANEEVEQPFNADVWTITLEARDALGFLEDLAFVDGDTGLNWTDNKTVIETIADCIYRGYGQPLLAMDIYASTGFTLQDDSNFETNAYVEMDAFLDDNGEPQSCKEVLEAMLEALGCTIFMYRGKYVVVNIELWTTLLQSNLDYRIYDETGTYQSADAWPVSATKQRIGSDISYGTLETYHVNQNTSYIDKKFYTSVRLKQVFEYRDQIIPNGEMETEGAGPYTIANWTLEAGEAEAFSDGIVIQGYELSSEIVDAATSDTMTLKAGNRLQLTLEVEYVDDPTQQEIEVELVGSTETYYLRKNVGQSTVTWTEVVSVIRLDQSINGIEEGVFTHVIDFPDLPIDGDLTIVLRSASFGGDFSVNSETVVRGVLMEAIEDIEEGIEWTAERTDNTTGSIPDVREVRFASADSSVYKNTFFDSAGALLDHPKFDGTGTTSTLYRLAQSILTLRRGRFIDLTGDMKGDVEFMTPKRMDTIGGNYVLGSYDKDLSTDIASVSLFGYNKNATGATTSITSRIVYKESVKPKIK